MTVFGLKQASNTLADNLSELLLTMELADFNDEWPEWVDDEVRDFNYEPLRWLREVEPLTGNPALDILEGSREDIIDPREMEVTPSDLDGPLGIATVKPYETGDGWMFERYRSLPQDLFQEHNDSPPIVVEWTAILADVGADIKYSSMNHMGIYQDGRWYLAIAHEDGKMLKDRNRPGVNLLELVDADPTNQEAVDFMRQFDFSIKFALAKQFARYYEWRVVFRDHPKGTASLSLVTDPKGAQAAFKLRDKPKGAKRRPALKHWVRQHWRRKRSGDGASLVRAHLRGETDFVFEGMECRIIPSPFDIQRVVKKAS